MWGTALQWLGRTGRGKAAVPIPHGGSGQASPGDEAVQDTHTVFWDTGWGDPPKAGWEVAWETPSPTPGVSRSPPGAERRLEGHVCSSHPGQGPKRTRMIFVGLFGWKLGCRHPFSTLDGSDFTAGWGRGSSGGNPPRNPGTEPPMKYSGCSARFPPRRRKHHEYCRWALKFHGCHASVQPCGHRYRRKPLCQDASRLHQAPATRFPLLYPQNGWW